MDLVMARFSGRSPKYTCTIINAISPTPARPCSTYIIPQVVSLNRYGLRGKKIVRTRDIMKTPVTIADRPAAMMAAWYSLFSSGYLANLRGGGAGRHRNRRILLRASVMSILSGQMDQKSSQKDA